MLNIIAAWIDAEYIPPFDVLFVGNSAEEGLGDLRGTKEFMKYCSKQTNIDLKAFIALDSSLDRITHIACGVKRYKVTLKTQGGHSWGNFGSKSAIHEIGKIISEISNIEVPKDPKTTFNVGLIEGGTSINTIAQKAIMYVDLRSQDTKALMELETKFLKIIEKFTKSGDSESIIEQVGNRPSGSIPISHPLVKIGKNLANKYFIKMNSSISSTDANIPLSKGIPAITIGCYSGNRSHTLEEYIDINSLKKGIPFVNTTLIAVIEWIILKEESANN
jgi:acetylornithine deacetylase/succinyl-diaminopimelate desuccinylase-like protein